MNLAPKHLTVESEVKYLFVSWQGQCAWPSKGLFSIMFFYLEFLFVAIDNLSLKPHKEVPSTWGSSGSVLPSPPKKEGCHLKWTLSTCPPHAPLPPSKNGHTNYPPSVWSDHGMVYTYNYMVIPTVLHPSISRLRLDHHLADIFL